MKTCQGVKNFTQEEATKIAGEDPDYMIRDMFEAIEREEYPSWNVFVQVMDPSEAENYKWNIFDMTKVWPHTDFPLRKIGKMTLNRNVSFLDLVLCFATPQLIQKLKKKARQLLRRYWTGGIFPVEYGTGIFSFRRPW